MTRKEWLEKANDVQKQIAELRSQMYELENDLLGDIPQQVQELIALCKKYWHNGFKVKYFYNDDDNAFYKIHDDMNIYNGVQYYSGFILLELSVYNGYCYEIEQFSIWPDLFFDNNLEKLKEEIIASYNLEKERKKKEYEVKNSDDYKTYIMLKQKFEK